MTDLIRREDAINAICGCCEFGENHMNVCRPIESCRYKEALETVPAIDAVEVVRCRDCCYFTPVNMYGGIGGRCSRMFESRGLWATGYCSMGVRKEDVDE